MTPSGSPPSHGVASQQPAAARADCRVEPWTVFSGSEGQREGDSVEEGPGDACKPDATGWSNAKITEAAAFARTRGYVVLRDAVSRQAIEALASTVQAAGEAVGVLTQDGTMTAGGWRGSPFDDPRWVQLLQRVLPDETFLNVGDAPTILQVLRALFGEEVRTRRGDICRILAPARPLQTTRPHQDHWYLGGPPLVWTAWLPLHDCTVDEGGLGVLPNSHKGGFLPHSGDGNGRQGCEVDTDAVWVAGDLRAGDALLFHCMTVHRAWHNLGEVRPRVSVDFRYQPSSAGIHTDRVDGTKAGT